MTSQFFRVMLKKALRRAEWRKATLGLKLRQIRIAEMIEAGGSQKRVGGLKNAQRVRAKELA